MIACLLSLSQIVLHYSFTALFLLFNLAKTPGIHSTGKSRCTFQVHRASKEANSHLTVRSLYAYVKKILLFLFHQLSKPNYLSRTPKILLCVVKYSFTTINCSFVQGMPFFSWNQVYFAFSTPDFHIRKINGDATILVSW